ncbi:helix-turn-helix domain-containing protein [Phaeobacter sp.]|uniref:helix-turn-helix domain-containing protein n=1 Tax=Phaeobacter sp. TaxID=1902409 RepID=UPI0025FC2C32|nr:helix-turn-helix domain-containing protein [Phaeobacter sp.]
MYDDLPSPQRHRDPGLQTCSFTFICPHQHNSLAIHACQDLLDAANTLAGQPLYRMTLSHRLDRLWSLDLKNRNRTLVLLGSSSERWQVSANTRSILRRKLPSAHRIGVVGGAAFLLPGVPGLKDKEVVAHPRLAIAAREDGIPLAATSDPAWVHGRLHSAVSGIAALHMILDMMAQDHGTFFSQTVAADIGLVRDGMGNQLSLFHRFSRMAEGHDLVLRGLALMRAHIEEPMSARQLAARLAISPRQLERSFRNKLDQSPMAAYRGLRLEHARQLLTQTDLPLIQVSLASGFSATSTLSHWYRACYGELPGDTRKRRYCGAAG